MEFEPLSLSATVVCRRLAGGSLQILSRHVLSSHSSGIMNRHSSHCVCCLYVKIIYNNLVFYVNVHCIYYAVIWRDKD